MKLTIFILCGLALGPCAGCLSTPSIPEPPPITGMGQGVGTHIAKSLVTGEGIILMMGSLLFVAATISILAPIISKSMPNWPGTITLIGCALSFWVLAAAFSWIMAWLVPIFLVGACASVFVFRHHILRWAEKQFWTDFNHNGSIGT